MNNYRMNCNNRRMMGGASPAQNTTPNFAVRGENRGGNMTGGCGNDRREMREERRDCGCGNDRWEAREERKDCGCGNERREAREERRDCGCGNERREAREERKDCGCGNDRREERKDCGCEVGERLREVKSGERSSCKEFPIAMAYVPWQVWRNLYEPCEAFRNGTIFKELDLEFLGRRCN